MIEEALDSLPLTPDEERRLDDAEAVLEDDSASDAARRKAHAAIGRLRGRRRDLGVASVDFAAVLGETWRIHYSLATGRADPSGDAQMLATLVADLDAEDSLPDLAALIARPYVLVKRNLALDTAVGGEAYHYTYPRRFRPDASEARDDPLQDGDVGVVLFEQHTGRPAMVARVLALDRATAYNATSGTLVLDTRPAVAEEGDE